MSSGVLNKVVPLALAVIAALMVLGAVWPGALFVTKYEGDTLHLMQILARMEAGQTPHIDFNTPIGALAFWPMVLLIRSFEMGFGAAFVWGQVLIGTPILLAAIYAVRRIARPAAWLGIGAILILTLALVHGEPDKAVAVSMHYNRWSWSILYVVVIASLFSGGNTRIDGVLIGLGMAALALIKATYFAAFAPAVIVALLARKAWLELGIAALTGLAVVAALTAIHGFDYWTFYIRDLIIVSESQVRDAPGKGFGDVVSAPQYIAGSLLGLAGVVLLRRSGAAQAGLVLLLLLPGFFYVTFQNFGNDPQWLPLLAVICLTAAQSPALRAVVFAVLVLSVPSFLNMMLSPVRHLTSDRADYTVIVPDQGNRSDIWTESVRAETIQASRPLSVPPLFDPSDDEGWAEAQTTFMGEELPDCTVGIGLPNWFGTVAGDIEAAGFGGSKIFVADLLSAYWLYGAIEPPLGGAPWYYGGLPGMRDADYLMVPLCAVLPKARGVALDAVTDAGTDRLGEVHRTELYVLYEIRAAR